MKRISLFFILLIIFYGCTEKKTAVAPEKKSAEVLKDAVAPPVDDFTDKFDAESILEKANEILEFQTFNDEESERKLETMAGSFVDMFTKASDEGRLGDLIVTLEELEDQLPKNLDSATEEVRAKSLSLKMSLELAYSISAETRKGEVNNSVTNDEAKKLPPLAVALFADYGISVSTSSEKNYENRLHGLGIAEVKKYGKGIFEFINSKEEAERWIELSFQEKEWEFASMLLDESFSRGLIDKPYFESNKPTADAGVMVYKIYDSMIYVKSGSFLMGSEEGAENEKPVHNVILSEDFYIAPYQITFEIYDLYCLLNDIKPLDDQGWGRGLRPVIKASWLDAILFANWMSTMAGLAPAYSVNDKEVSINIDSSGFRLPTEAEWEYAARNNGSDKLVFSEDSDINNFAWFKGNSGGKTHPVGQKTSNGIGCYDMNGNVWEWCWDSYKANYYAESNEKDPEGPNWADVKVVRGGSYNDRGVYLQNTFRFFFAYTDSDHRLGFRMFRSAKGII